jgi:hypothetical protein
MANQWFRMYSEFATDPKVQMLSEPFQRRLTMLFCLRCNGNVTLQDEEVTFLLRITPDEWIATKQCFIAKGFISESNEILNWDKRQFASDTSKNRVAAYRERKKNDSNVTVTLPEQKSNGIDTEHIQNRTDTESDTEKTITPLAKLVALGVSKKSAQTWLKIRKDKKLTFTDEALEIFKREVNKAGMELQEGITYCNGRSWGSFKFSWYQADSKPKNGNLYQQKQEEREDYNKQTNAKLKARLFGAEKEVHDAS